MADESEHNMRRMLKTTEEIMTKQSLLGYFWPFNVALELSELFPCDDICQMGFTQSCGYVCTLKHMYQRQHLPVF